MASLLASSSIRSRMAVPASRAVSRPARRVVLCKAAHEEKWAVQRLALPVATAVATALISGAIVPEEAFAAKSGGRAGGSGFQSRRAAPAQTSSRTTVVNNYVAAPVMAPPVFGGWGFGGFSIMPTFVVPLPFAGLGTIFSLFFVLAMVSVVFNVVSNMKSNNKSNDWDN